MRLNKVNEDGSMDVRFEKDEVKQFIKIQFKDVDDDELENDLKEMAAWTEEELAEANAEIELAWTEAVKEIMRALG